LPPNSEQDNKIPITYRNKKQFQKVFPKIQVIKKKINSQVKEGPAEENHFNKFSNTKNSIPADIQ
tara:strand:+ start:194 stop:388 length:195 start_codon:yes stop_codon:yes gene_type:complete